MPVKLQLLLQVHWWGSLQEVPTDGPALYIAHEFFDALPAHQFQRTNRGWCERLVDAAPDDSPLHLALVLSPGPTPATELLSPRRLTLLAPAESESLLSPFQQRANIALPQKFEFQGIG